MAWWTVAASAVVFTPNAHSGNSFLNSDRNVTETIARFRGSGGRPCGSGRRSSRLRGSCRWSSRLSGSCRWLSGNRWRRCYCGPSGNGRSRCHLRCRRRNRRRNQGRGFIRSVISKVEFELQKCCCCCFAESIINMSVYPDDDMETSAQDWNVSCGPHPKAPVPLGQFPQRLPVVYFHCFLKLLNSK